MGRIAFGLPLALEDRLAAEAVRHGHEVVVRSGSAAELAVQVTAARPDLAVVSAEPRYLTDRLIAACDDAGVRLAVLVEQESGRRNAAALGVYETADATAPWTELESALDTRTPLPRPAASRGQVIAVWGPAGAPGRTTVAIGIAAELAALGHTVALADVDTHGASVAPALGMLDEAPGFAAACRLAGAGSLTRAELERIGQRYESALGGFWVLTGIGRPSRWPELSADRVATTVRECRDWVEYTILDTSSSLENDEEISSDLFAPRRNAATVTAVREADRVVAVGSADPVGLSRFLRAHVDVMETAATEDVTVVMNRVRASAIGMNPSGQVTRTLSRFGAIESPVLIPHDLAAVDGAVLSGKTLADSAPRSAARLALRELVETRLTARGTSRRGRLFGRARADAAPG